MTRVSPTTPPDPNPAPGSTSPTYDVDEISGYALATSFGGNSGYADFILILDGLYYSVCEDTLIGDPLSRGDEVIQIMVSN